MSHLTFTLQDCDHVVQKCLQNSKVYATDLEIIPRHQTNFIFKITTSQNETLYFYAKPSSHLPRIDLILEDFQIFDLRISPKFICGKSNLLFFEDLTYQKFQTYLNLYDLRHVQQALEILAEFHAAGVNYEFRNSEKLVERYELENANFDVRDTKDLVHNLIGSEERVEEIMKKLLERQSSKFVKTVCHSNLAAGNCLFFYENGSPKKCRLINFQTKYAPPAYDVLQLVFFNTSQETRRIFFHDFLSYYYQHFEDKLKKYNLNIFNFDEFLNSVDFLLPVVKLEAVFLKKAQELKQLNKELRECFDFSKISREDCYLIIKKRIGSTNYDLAMSDLQASKTGDDFFLKIQIRRNSNNETLNFAVKSTSKKEKFFYGNLLPQTEAFSNSLSTECFPVCYFQKLNISVFDDLLSLGYQTVSPPYSSRIASIILKHLARFHAALLIFEEGKSEETKTTYRLSDHTESWFSFKVNLEVFSALGIESLRQKFEEQEESLQGLRKVLCIGINPENVLIKFKNDQPVHCKFFNLHPLRYESPVVDFLHILNLSSEDRELFNKVYYRELAESLAAFNLNVEKFLPYNIFEDSLRYFEPKIIFQAMICKVFGECLIPDDEKNRKEIFEEKMKNTNIAVFVEESIKKLHKVLNNSKN